MPKTCKRCGGTEWLRRGTGRERCKACRQVARLEERRQRKRPERRWQTKATLMASLGVQGCEHCDFVPTEDVDYAAIDFHHRDRGVKEFGIAQAMQRRLGMSRLLTEVKKCMVLCSNCHRIHHAREGDHSTSQLDKAEPNR